jgi:hypothetical protein
MERIGSGDAERRLAMRLSETRKHLGELPDLFAQLSHFWEPGSSPKDPDQRRGKSNPAHRSVVNLDVLDLTDVREKANAEPTRTDYDLDRRAGARRQGVLPTLASWSRLVDSELWDAGIEHEEQAAEATVSGECGYLLRHMTWIGQQAWLNELHDDVEWLRKDLRRAIGDFDRPTLRLVCPQCGSPSELINVKWLACSLSDRHDTSVDDLEGQYRRKPPMTTSEVCREFRVSSAQLWQWKTRRKITPIPREGRELAWLPWDVFCVLNPDIKKAIDMRDAAADAVA